MKNIEGQRVLRNRVLIVVIALVIALAAIVLSCVANNARTVTQNGEYLAASTDQTAQRVNELLEDSLRDVETTAAVFEESLESPEIDPAEAAKVMDLPQFDHTFFITPRGLAFKPDGTTGTATEKYYYSQGIQGSSGVCYIDDALFDGESVAAFFTPVRFDERIAGVVVCAYRESSLASYLAVSFSGQQMPTYLCEADGRIIASASPEETPNSKYMADVFAGALLEGASVEQVAEKLENGGSVGFTYEASGGTSCAHATKLASFDWVVVRELPSSITGAMAAEANLASALLAGCLILVAAVAMALLLRQQRAKGTGPLAHAEDAKPETTKRASSTAPAKPSVSSQANPPTNGRSTDAKESAKGTGPLAHAASSRVESVFASSLSKEIRSHEDLPRDDVKEVDVEEVARQEAERLAKEQERLKGLGCHDKRILLTEDNAMATSIAKELLELTGAEVEHAENGKAAVEMLLDRDPGYYDIVLMDIQMPVMNGYDATRAIREAAANRPDLDDIPVIALSADMFADDIKSSQEAGMNDHIAKPLEVSTLVDMLQKWMD